MSIKNKRTLAVEQCISQIRHIIGDNADIASLQAAKKVLMDLCLKTELFPRSEFPVPGAEQTERTFLIHEDASGEYALYVNSGGPGQMSPPHNHGGCWAIIAAIEGEELHRLYIEKSIMIEDGTAELKQVNEINVKPGCAVSMLEDGIHSIHAGNKPLLHLHLYGKRYASQMERKVYNIESGSFRSFVLDDVGFVEDAR